jgi:hypothetical protein
MKKTQSEHSPLGARSNPFPFPAEERPKLDEVVAILYALERDLEMFASLFTDVAAKLEKRREVGDADVPSPPPPPTLADAPPARRCTPTGESIAVRALYVRADSDAQATIAVRELRSHARRRGWINYTAYVDEGPNAPALAELVNEIAAGRTHLVLVDRFSDLPDASLVLALKLLAHVDAGRADVFDATTGLDLTGRLGRSLFMAALSDAATEAAAARSEGLPDETEKDRA